MRGDSLPIGQQPCIDLSQSNDQTKIQRRIVDKPTHKVRSARGIVVEVALYNPRPEACGVDIAGKLVIQATLATHVVYRSNLDLMSGQQPFKNNPVEEPLAGDADSLRHTTTSQVEQRKLFGTLWTDARQNGLTHCQSPFEQ